MSATESPSRRLIVNADDFGLSPGVNAGVIATHERGVVTSASLMVRQPASEEAASYIRKSVTLDAGLHVDLGEWEFDEGEWRVVYQRVDLDDAAAVDKEVREQVSLFEAMTGQVPTHVDSHQHVHLREQLRHTFEAVVEGLGVPLRHHGPVHYCGDFYAQTAEGEPLPGRVGRAALLVILDHLPAGVSELACHPAAVVDMPGVYGAERVEETTTLCDETLFTELTQRGVVLSNFGDLAS